MSTTVLGKRQRTGIEAEASLPLRRNTRRRTQPPQIYHEDISRSSLPTRQLRSRTKVGDELERGNGATINNSPGGTEQVTRAPVPESQAPSPSQENTEPTTSEIANDEDPKFAEIRTPSKSRYRNALESPPITPKRRVQVGGISLTPRTPRQVATPTTGQTIYTQARRLFARGASSARIVGRDTERQKLASFIKGGIQSRKGGCLYVSGPPGTGKSALVREVLDEIDLKSLRVAQLNCASMRSARDVYSKLIEDLSDDGEIFKKTDADRLRSMFTPDDKQVGNQEMFLVMLDEIDHLLAADAGVLQSLFEWSLQKESKVILIGIANALDLTDRSLPQLKSKNLKPLLLPFLPYNANQIANVIIDRLRSLLPGDQTDDPSFIPFVHPAAIQLCAKKVASQTGDLRKAFELIKRAVDIIEQETLQKFERQNPVSPSKTILVENNNLSSPQHLSPEQDSTRSYTALTAPRASIAHVAKITSSVFGQGTAQRLQCLNLQQKAAICALIALDRKRRESDLTGTPTKSKNSAPTVKQIFETYCTLCRTDNILHPLTSTEFKDVLGSLETLGLVGEYQSRGRGGTVSGGSDLRRTPSKSNGGSLNKALDEQSLVCFVSQKEIERQITGPGEGILMRLFSGEGL
ncbi:AAA family ATPase CDC6 [Aspergillus lucknowensis]|uniref:Cell division control protein n=1 Tax=Aspergillus lucknowensis TaxID=176173 RepID=A0ABR4L8M4_9EURO